MGAKETQKKKGKLLTCRSIITKKRLPAKLGHTRVWVYGPILAPNGYSLDRASKSAKITRRRFVIGSAGRVPNKKTTVENTQCQELVKNR